MEQLKIIKANQPKSTVRNRMKLEIESVSENESFARSTVAAFASQLNPTLDEINDIKTAVSEAVTNCVVHAYGKGEGKIVLECELSDNSISIVIKDNGVGIDNIEKALEPFYTTKPGEERSGMGFTVMQSFMDTLDVKSSPKGGTTVKMQKFFTNPVAESTENTPINRGSLTNLEYLSKKSKEKKASAEVG